jgi:hypothetical protein
MTRRRRFLLSACLILLGILFSASIGCGKSKSLPESKVRGTVKMDGQPLKEGIIMFSSTEASTAGKSSTGPISNGAYEIVAFPGEKLVSISAQLTVKRKVSHSPDAPEIDVPGDQLISAKYNTESKLKITIKPGDNTQNFDTESIKKAGR